jgi:AraC-like DNA-binding protein
VAHVLAYDEVLPEGVEATERVFPDGALRLIFDVEGGAPASRVAGPSATPVLLTTRGRVQGLSVTLLPGSALALFGVGAHELAERVVAWDDLAGPGERHLVERLQGADAEGTRVHILLDGLLGMLRDVDGVDLRRARRAAALFRNGGGARSVCDVAARVGVGERRLQQNFRAHVGLAPRTWSRLARMQECLRALRGDTAPVWSGVAASAGFYDQAHLIKEFRAFCGLTPEQFQRRTISRSSKTGG